ncbi:MAG TPA: hypothetical protein PKK61_04280 [Defluviitaleaceae bacterium]|nr:hypothetical protein [Candidatus Epulonipiscium sp.]HOA80265.1 hypothetical protein [Defluviitaleaceae bacterium]
MSKKSVDKKFIVDIVFIIATAVVLFIIFNNIDYPVTNFIIISYLIFVFVYFLINLFKSFRYIKKYKWILIKKILIRFITAFCILFIILVAFERYIRVNGEDYLRAFANAIGIAFGISFFDSNIEKTME